jgi:hypothetical protein
VLVAEVEPPPPAEESVLAADAHGAVVVVGVVVVPVVLVVVPPVEAHPARFVVSLLTTVRPAGTGGGFTAWAVVVELVVAV